MDSLIHLDYRLSQKGDSSQLYDWAENFVYRVTPSISYYTSMYDHDNDEATDSVAIIGESKWMIDNRSFNEDTQKWEEGDSIIATLINSSGTYQIVPSLKKISHNILTMFKRFTINTVIIFQCLNTLIQLVSVHLP